MLTIPTLPMVALLHLLFVAAFIGRYLVAVVSETYIFFPKNDME